MSTNPFFGGTEKMRGERPLIERIVFALWAGKDFGTLLDTARERSRKAMELTAIDVTPTREQAE